MKWLVNHLVTHKKFCYMLHRSYAYHMKNKIKVCDVCCQAIVSFSSRIKYLFTTKLVLCYVECSKITEHCVNRPLMRICAKVETS